MSQRNHFVDVAKGISIILVLFNHYEWQKQSLFNTHLYYWVICMAVPVFMLCTGYVTAASFENKGITLKTAYTKKALLPKLARYIMPVLWFYIAETVLTLVFAKTGYFDYLSSLNFLYSDSYTYNLTLANTVMFFFVGGRGLHGTYYFPVILQVAFMIPLVYSCVKKWKWGLWLCFGINLVLEIAKNCVDMPSGVYRLLAFRYIFALALGCFLYIYRENLGKWYKWTAFFVIGCVYVYVVNYAPVKREIFTYWYRTSMIAMLYITPIFLLGLKKMSNVKCTFLENIGKASYHILMVQILYYNYLAPIIWTAPKRIIPNDFAGFVVSAFVCIGAGYCYYLIYNCLSAKFAKHCSFVSANI